MDIRHQAEDIIGTSRTYYKGLQTEDQRGNREEHTAKTSYTTFIEVLQKVVVFEFEVVRNDSKSETGVGEVYRDASYLGLDEGDIRIWDSLYQKRVNSNQWGVRNRRHQPRLQTQWGLVQASSGRFR